MASAEDYRKEVSRNGKELTLTIFKYDIEIMVAKDTSIFITVTDLDMGDSEFIASNNKDDILNYAATHMEDHADEPLYNIVMREIDDFLSISGPTTRVAGIKRMRNTNRNRNANRNRNTNKNRNINKNRNTNKNRNARAKIMRI